MAIETISWRKGRVRIVDQTKLPGRFEYIHCKDVASLIEAIASLKVRGAPAIGIAGALGALLSAANSKARTRKKFIRGVLNDIKRLAGSRPTARNLFWALERMRGALTADGHESVSDIKAALAAEAADIVNEDKSVCRRMAAYGAGLIKNGDTILTHCNAGGLATADYGTALGVIFEAKKQGKKIVVYAGETRPLLQGARLTTWELMKRGIKTILICDNMAASLMEKGKVKKIFVGADRIASNGDTANKIGTYSLAVLARYHKIPFYVVAPKSTFDLTLKNGRDIPIEERKKDEVTCVGGSLVIAPKNVGVWNPAFDVTPNELITAIVTEAGIFRPPYSGVLKKLKK